MQQNAWRTVCSCEWIATDWQMNSMCSYVFVFVTAQFVWWSLLRQYFVFVFVFLLTSYVLVGEIVRNCVYLIVLGYVYNYIYILFCAIYLYTYHHSNNQISTARLCDCVCVCVLCVSCVCGVRVCVDTLCLSDHRLRSCSNHLLFVMCTCPFFL